MKKQVLVAAFAVLGITQVNAQEGSVLDKVSLEASYGMAMPLSPTDNITASDYNSLTNFTGAINYKLNNVWGVRASFGFHDFEHKNNNKLGVTYYKFMAEATYNILTAVNQSASFTQSQSFDVVAHAGIGGSFATRKRDNATNKMGNVQIGLKPTYAVAPRVNIFLDGTYVMNFNQSYQFSGTSIKGGTTGSYVSTAIGLQVKLGK